MEKKVRYKKVLKNRRNMEQKVMLRTWRLWRITDVKGCGKYLTENQAATENLDAINGVNNM